MLLEKYSPRSIRDMTGNQKAADQVRDFVRGWKKGSAAILSGPCGAGKSLTLRLIAAELGWELIEGDAKEVAAAGGQSSLWKRGKLLEVNLDGGSKPGEIAKLVESSSWPVCLITEDVYDARLYEIRRMGFPIFRYYKAFPGDIARLLKKIATAEKIRHDDAAILALSQASDGDVRWAVSTLESISAATTGTVEGAAKDRQDKLFERLDAVFGSRAEGLDDLDDLAPWIEENLAERYADDKLLFAMRCMELCQRYLARRLAGYPEDFIRLLPKSYGRGQYRPPLRMQVPELDEVAGRVHCSARKAMAYGQLVQETGMRGLVRL
jgi:DNA polymerase III delta prime subunit